MENIIGYYCAPALAGIKASNIVNCYKNRGYDIQKETERLNLELNKKDIYLKSICECEKRVLLMVYRKKALEQVLKKDEISEFLKSFGYPHFTDIDTHLEFLKTRLKRNDFPHEIGAFLGYPLHDIYGFIFHKNEGCLLCGEWKVYKNPEEARKMFSRFSACRKAVLEKMHRGYTLARMFCAS